MGNVLGQQTMAEVRDQSQEGASIEVDENNGLILNGTYIPPEILTHILASVELKDMVTKARRVCKTWREIIQDAVWHEKVLAESPGTDARLFNIESLTWPDFYYLCHTKPFGRNLIKNGSATDKMDFWIANPGSRNSNSQYHNHYVSEGRKWAIEKSPTGCDPFPEGISHCFVTSYDWCSAEQVINLRENGLTKNVMDFVRPDIHIEEWYAGRFDCGFEYILKVSLLSFNWEVLDTFTSKVREHTTEWKKVQHTFSNYPKGVAFVVFHHKGKDTQFWAGHYGSKMTGAKVCLTLPKQLPEEQQHDSQQQ